MGEEEEEEEEEEVVVAWGHKFLSFALFIIYVKYNGHPPTTDWHVSRLFS